jgi:hypothetical protein
MNMSMNNISSSGGRSDRNNFNISSIAVVPTLMESSYMDRKLSILEEYIDNQKIKESMNIIIAKMVKTAYSLKYQRQSYDFQGNAPGGLCYGNFYSGARSFCNDLPPWQQRFIKAAMHKSLSQPSKTSKDDLQISLGLMLRASGECMARKQDVFNKIIQRSVPDSIVNTNEENPHSIDYHKKILFDAAMIKVDEMKNYAFNGTFIEPSKMYFRAVGDGTIEGDVGVHGSNTYLAFLHQSLGIKLSRSPLLDDEVKGVVPFKECLRKQDLDKLWDPENKGASWEILLKTSYPTVQKTTRKNTFYGNGWNVEDISINCSRPEYIKHIEPYMAAFARYFEKDQVVKILINYFLSEYDHLETNLNAIFRHLATDEEFESSGQDVRNWLWDIMTLEFRQDKAYQLLCCAGILKNNM